MRALLVCLVITVATAAAVIWNLPAQVQPESFAVAHSQEIRSVSLDGRGLPLAALRDLLTTRTGAAIDLAALARDRAALEDALVARGYLSAHVDDARVTFAFSGALVTFAIAQGPLFRIRNVAITGATARDAGIVALGGGETADAFHISLARQALEQRLRARGKRRVVVATIAPDARAGLVDIELAASN